MESTTTYSPLFFCLYYPLIFKVTWKETPLLLNLFIGLPVEIFVIWIVFKLDDYLSTYRKCLVGQSFIDLLIIVSQLLNFMSTYLMCSFRHFVLLTSEMHIILLPFQEFSLVISAVYWKTVVKQTRFDKILLYLCVVYYCVFQMGATIVYYLLNFIIPYNDEHLGFYKIANYLSVFYDYSSIVSFLIVFYTFIMVVRIDKRGFSRATQRGHVKMTVALLLQIILIVFLANDKFFFLIQNYFIGKSSALLGAYLEIARNGTNPLEMEKITLEQNEVSRIIQTLSGVQITAPAPLYKALITLWSIQGLVQKVRKNRIEALPASNSVLSTKTSKS